MRSAGVGVWIDEGGIHGASLWGQEIVDAIESAKVMVLMLSVAFEMDFRHRICTAGVFARNLVNDFVAGNQNHLALVGYSR